MKKYLKWIICVMSFIFFIILCTLVITKKDIYLDSLAYNFISKYISNDLTYVVKNLTNIASTLSVILVTILVFVFYKNKKYGIFLSVDLIVITVLQFILKFIFMRGRPLDINLIEETGYSFPSGHTLTAMAFYGFIIYLIYVSKICKRSKIIFITLLSLLILVVGVSRVYLGVHYFTDILGGFTFSLSFLIIYTHLIKDKLK